MSKNLAMEKGLPAALEAERFLIGSILTDSMRMDEVAGSITVETFSLERHRRIWQRCRILSNAESALTGSLSPMNSGSTVSLRASEGWIFWSLSMTDSPRFHR